VTDAVTVRQRKSHFFSLKPVRAGSGWRVVDVKRLYQPVGI